jgi:5-methylcytosine-specific restriction endonuclease McrA
MRILVDRADHSEHSATIEGELVPEQARFLRGSLAGAVHSPAVGQSESAAFKLTPYAVTYLVTRPLYCVLMEPITSVSDVVSAFTALSDDELVERVKHLAACERRASVALIRSLVEFDTRRLYLREGCSSLFAYCTQVLHLSEGSAYNRIETARAARRYPKVLEALELGDLTLSAVRLLAPHLTPANHADVLAAARHRTKQGIQEQIASLNPRPAAATVIRRVAARPSNGGSPPPVAAPAETEAPSTTPPGVGLPPASGGQDVAETARTVPRLCPANVTPLAPDLYKLQVTLTRQTHVKLRHAQALSRHTLVGRDVASILDRALTMLIDHLERTRFARVVTPRPSRIERASGRHIPAAVRRAVWQRDEGRCAFVGRTGRCRETSFLEFHHVAPYAEGGAATAANIQLRCRAHNQYEARLVFGDMFVREQRPPYPGHDGRTDESVAVAEEKRVCRELVPEQARLLRGHTDRPCHSPAILAIDPLGARASRDGPVRRHRAPSRTSTAS